MTRQLVVIGGGTVGLSIAWQAARRGMAVTVVESQAFGENASWAAAGILPYVNPATARHPLDCLTAASHCLHAAWSEELVGLTGIDYEFASTGTIQIARTTAERASLCGLLERCCDDRVPAEPLRFDQLAAEVPSLGAAIERREILYALRLPLDCQLRASRFLAALRAACQGAGAEILEQAGHVELVAKSGAIAAAKTEHSGELSGDEFCVAAGAWSGNLLQPLGVSVRLVPIRGQIAYFKLAAPPFHSVLYEGGRYLVPRRDGGLLAGSTLEDAGFDARTTADAIDGLSRFAATVIPALAGRAPDRAWAGLRPATFDGYPYLGRVPAYANLILAAGHFRAGVHLAPATAAAVCDMLEGKPPQFDLRPFRPGRG